MGTTAATTQPSKNTTDEVSRKLNEAASQIDPRVGQRYRHYKGNFYLVVGFCMHEPSMTVQVIYERTDGSAATFCRPLSDWNQRVMNDNGKECPRFKRVMA